MIEGENTKNEGQPEGRQPVRQNGSDRDATSCSGVDKARSQDRLEGAGTPWGRDRGSHPGGSQVRDGDADEGDTTTERLQTDNKCQRVEARILADPARSLHSLARRRRNSRALVRILHPTATMWPARRRHATSPTPSKTAERPPTTTQ